MCHLYGEWLVSLISNRKLYVYAVDDARKKINCGGDVKFQKIPEEVNDLIYWTYNTNDLDLE